MIPRNSMLPVRARKLFATTTDDQKFVSIELYQGEIDRRRRRTASSARSCSTICRPGPPGSVRVELVMTVDVESILSVTARELQDRQARRA